MTDRDALVAAAERVHKEFDRTDVLINKAGVKLLAPFTFAQRDEFRQMIEVNLLGAITATKYFSTSSATVAVTWSTSPPWQAAPPASARRLRRYQVGHQRLVEVASPGAAARHPGDAHRVRRDRH